MPTKAVRQRYKNGADVIKITATGGVLSVAKDGQGPQFTVEEVEAIVQTADDYGFVTAAHAHGAGCPRRYPQYRAWHLHDRRSHAADEGERYVLRAYYFRRKIRL